MEKIQHYVLYNEQRGRWEVRRSNARRPSRIFVTRTEALAYAHAVSLSQKTELVIHRPEGGIEETIDHTVPHA